MTKEYMINLNTIDKVKNFANVTTTLSCEDIRLISDRYVIDGKSILGIFSLNLSQDIKMQLNGNEDEINEAVNALGRFMI